MNIEKAEEKLLKGEHFLVTLKGVLRRNWGILVFLLFCYCVYWAFNQPTAPVLKELIPQEQYQENYESSYDSNINQQEDSIWDSE